MRDFRRGGDRFSNNNSFEKRGNRGGNFGRNSDKKEMFPAICDECGNKCLVPFKPSNNKPIYCSDCFEKMGNTSNRDFGNNDRSFNRNNRQSNFRREERNNNEELIEQIEILNSKINKILTILENNRVEIATPKVVKVKKEKIKKDKE